MLRAADAVVALSEFTKDEIVELVGVPLGEDPRRTERRRQRLLPDGAQADGDYVLAVATLEPRKNLERDVEAARLAGVELRVVGARGWGGVDVPGWVGEISDAELAALYRGARCVVFASLYEGFGIPVLEAMASGTPAVTSRGGATEEVAGGAAVLVDPLDVRVDRRRDRRGGLASRGARPARSRESARVHLGGGPRTRSSRSGESSREAPRRGRRRRPRPRAHGRRDLRP